ncbi:MAG: hypothetical protein WA184_17285, partial [Stellaceae bacterium]
PSVQPLMPPQMPAETGERPIGRYDYEDGSYVRVVASGDIETEEALQMVETLIELKRRELTRRKAAVAIDIAKRPVARPVAKPEEDGEL